MTAIGADRDAAPTLAAVPRTGQRFRSDEAKAYALVSPALIAVTVGLGAPLVLLILYSFWTQSYLTIDHTFTLANYTRIFTQPLYWPIFARTFLTSAAVTLTTVVLAYPVAYFIAFDVKKNKTLWLILITLPFWTSYLLRVFTWKIILGYQGVINSGLMSLGLISEPLQFILYNPFSVYLTLVYGWLTFAILPIYVSLEKIDRSYLEAATDLGDTAFERFWRITFPLSLPGVISAALVIFIPTVGDYVTPALVGGPDGMMIANIIQAQFGKANNYPLGAALSVVSMVAVTVLAGLLVLVTKRLTARIG
jgi:spermidine/putrescine transport system permease protein